MAASTYNNSCNDNSIAEYYWTMLSKLSDGVKLRLATKLTSSVADDAERRSASAERTRLMLNKHAGSWAGDETTDEIMATIRQNSSSRNPIEL